MDLVIYFINIDKNFDILGHSSVSRTLENLPSWAPDWSSGEDAQCYAWKIASAMETWQMRGMVYCFRRPRCSGYIETP